VRPAAIDRDALVETLTRAGVGPRGSMYVEDVADAILALVRPGEAVTLTRDEAARALDWCRRSVPAWSPEDEALAARLEAWRG
jgi:hypothetical protein